MLTKEWKYLFLIIVIFITACIETDIYLPAFTDMMDFFSVSEDRIQALLTWNFVGICISGPLYGPLSDALGRKKPLIVALGLFLIGSLMTVWANNFGWMLFGRALQGLGSGGCFTLGTAVIFDAFQKEKAVHALTKINTIVPFIMACAPMLGGYLNYAWGFRSNFMVIAICVFISFIICLFFFNETHPKEKRAPLQIKKILADFQKVCFNIPFWQMSLVVCFLFAGYLTFLSAISVLFVMELEVSKIELPFFQAALLGIWLVASLTCKKALAKYGTWKIKMVGTALTAIGGIGLIAATLFLPKNAYLLTAGMLFYSFGGNWIQGLYYPEAMELFPDIRGVTASLLTSFRLLLTSATVAVVSYFYNETIYPITMAIASIIVIMLISIYCYEKNREQSEEGLGYEEIFENI